MGARSHDATIQQLAVSLTIDQAIEHAYSRIRYLVMCVEDSWKDTPELARWLFDVRLRTEDQLERDLVALGVPEEAAQILARPE